MQRLTILVLLGAILSVAAFAGQVQTVMINGQQMMALSTFGDTFGAVIDYDTGHDGISIALHSHTVDMIPYSRTAWVDGCSVPLACPMVIVDGVTYVPVHFLCDEFELNCDWTNPEPVSVCPNTLESVCLVLDVGWPLCHHCWCYDYCCHDYWHFRPWAVPGCFAHHEGGSSWGSDRHPGFPPIPTTPTARIPREETTITGVHLRGENNQSHNRGSSVPNWSHAPGNVCRKFRRKIASSMQAARREQAPASLTRSLIQSYHQYSNYLNRSWGHSSAPVRQSSILPVTAIR